MSSRVYPKYRLHFEANEFGLHSLTTAENGEIVAVGHADGTSFEPFLGAVVLNIDFWTDEESEYYGKTAFISGIEQGLYESVIPRIDVERFEVIDE